MWKPPLASCGDIKCGSKALNPLLLTQYRTAAICSSISEHFELFFLIKTLYFAWQTPVQDLDGVAKRRLAGKKNELKLKWQTAAAFPGRLKSIRHQAKLSAFCAVIGATFNKLNMSPEMSRFIDTMTSCFFCAWKWTLYCQRSQRMRPGKTGSGAQLHMRWLCGDEILH